MIDNSSVGSSLDGFLAEDSLLAEVNAIALKRVLAWQILQEMKQRGLIKSQMAASMSTSRSSPDHILDTANTSVTIKTMDRAVATLGKCLCILLDDI